jgi:uncharacterized protein YukE
MSQIIVDPSEMRKFEVALRELQVEIDARRSQLETQIADVRSFWEDEKYTQFQRQSEELMLEVQYFSKLCDQYCDYLNRKAAAAEAYLHGR